MIQAVIIEDEAVAARKLQRLIKQLDQEVEVQAVLGSVAEALTWLSNHQPDLIFLDIHLSDGNSFELFEKMEVIPPIIFTTAYDQYAVQAFKQNSLHYLLKPIDLAELQHALSKFEQQYATAAPPPIDYTQLEALFNPEKHLKKRFLIQVGTKLRTVYMKEVAYFFLQNKATYLMTQEGRAYPIDFSLSQLEQQTDPARFFRINRQFLISHEALKELHTLSAVRLKATLQPPAEQEVFVAIDKIGKFKRWLGG